MKLPKTLQEFRDAANKQPRFRDGNEQDLVDEGRNILEIANLDFASKQRQDRGMPD